jgi:hypothetical protein
VWNANNQWKSKGVDSTCNPLSIDVNPNQEVLNTAMKQCKSEGEFFLYSQENMQTQITKAWMEPCKNANLNLNTLYIAKKQCEPNY